MNDWLKSKHDLRNSKHDPPHSKHDLCALVCYFRVNACTFINSKVNFSDFVVHALILFKNSRSLDIAIEIQGAIGVRMRVWRRSISAESLGIGAQALGFTLSGPVLATFSIRWGADHAWTAGSRTSRFDRLPVVILRSAILLRLSSQHESLRPNDRTRIDCDQARRGIDVECDCPLQTIVRHPGRSNRMTRRRQGRNSRSRNRLHRLRLKPRCWRRQFLR
jgi:hypothetical protein